MMMWCDRKRVLISNHIGKGDDVCDRVIADLDLVRMDYCFENDGDDYQHRPKNTEDTTPAIPPWTCSHLALSFLDCFGNSHVAPQRKDRSAQEQNIHAIIPSLWISFSIFHVIYNRSRIKALLQEHELEQCKWSVQTLWLLTYAQDWREFYFSSWEPHLQNSSNLNRKTRLPNNLAPSKRKTS